MFTSMDIQSNNSRAGSFRRSALWTSFAVLIAAALVMVAVAVSPAKAWAGNDGTDTLMRVNDFSGFLSESDESALSKKIKNLELTLRFDIVVYISGKTGTKDHAKSFYESNDCGYGDASDGLLLVYNPDSQKCATYANGTGNVIFSDSELRTLENAFVATAEKDHAKAVYDFLANSSIKAGAYQGVSVVSEWPDRTEASAVPNATTGTGASTHTTTELSWYPKDPASFKEFHNPDAPRVVDNADLLTDSEEAALVAKIKDMESRLGMDFVLYTDNSSYGLSRGLYAADFYTFNGYGQGDDYAGVIYFVCMEPGNRGFWTAACGRAQELMTEDNVNKMDDMTYDYFKSGDYAKAINTQFDNMDILYTNKGWPFNWNVLVGLLFIAAVASAIFASRVVGQMKKKMVSIRKASTAREYANSPVFEVRTDTHTGTTVTRTKHYEPDTDRGGGSSGGSSSYSGGYHSSGGSSHSFSGGGRSF